MHVVFSRWVGHYIHTISLIKWLTLCSCMVFAFFLSVWYILKALLTALGTASLLYSLRWMQYVADVASGWENGTFEHWISSRPRQVNIRKISVVGQCVRIDDSCGSHRRYVFRYSFLREGLCVWGEHSPLEEINRNHFGVKRCVKA